jgi:hypothetical protein
MVARALAMLIVVDAGDLGKVGRRGDMFNIERAARNA